MLDQSKFYTMNELREWLLEAAARGPRSLRDAATDALDYVFEHGIRAGRRFAEQDIDAPLPGETPDGDWRRD